MAKILSNRIQVSKALLGLGQAFSLRRPIGNGNRRLGDELIDTAAGAIVDRTVTRQLDDLGRPLRPLKRRTIERKARAGLDTRILIETHEMLDFGQVRGKTAITANTATMQAGLDDETQRKVEYAHEGGPNRPKRPFYDLGPNGERATDELFHEVVADAVRKAEET